MQTELELSHEANAGVFYEDKLELPKGGFKLRFVALSLSKHQANRNSGETLTSCSYLCLFGLQL